MLKVYGKNKMIPKIMKSIDKKTQKETDTLLALAGDHS